MMLKKLNIYLLLFSLILTVTACKVKKQIDEPDGISSGSTYQIWESIKKQNFDYEWYHTKADVDVSFEGFSMGGRADIRIRKDSVIFVSVRKFGLEMGRMLMRPDSVFAINRLQANYMALSIDSLKSEYNVPFDFQQLQTVIVGNHLTASQLPVSSEETMEGYVLKSTEDFLSVDYQLSKDFQVNKTSFLDEAGRSFEVEYKDYRDFNTLFLAAERSYFYPQKKDAEYTFKIKLDKVEIDQPKTIRFEIPPSYSKI